VSKKITSLDSRFKSWTNKSKF